MSISDSISKKFEMAKRKDVPDIKRNLKLTTGHIEALLSNRQSSPQSGLQAQTSQTVHSIQKQRIETPPKKAHQGVHKSERVKTNVDKMSECPTQQKQFHSKINPLMRKR